MKPFLKITTPERAEEEDWLASLTQTPEEKLDILQRLREIVHDLTHEDRKGFQRVLKVSRLEKS